MSLYAVGPATSWLYVLMLCSKLGQYSPDNSAIRTGIPITTTAVSLESCLMCLVFRPQEATHVLLTAPSALLCHKRVNCALQPGIVCLSFVAANYTTAATASSLPSLPTIGVLPSH